MGRTCQVVNADSLKSLRCTRVAVVHSQDELWKFPHKCVPREDRVKVPLPHFLRESVWKLAQKTVVPTKKKEKQCMFEPMVLGF